MISQIIKLGIVIIILIALQLALVPLISIKGVIPDLIVIYVVIFSLRNGQLKGTVFGFIVGLLFDLFSGGLLGSAMFAKTLAGFVAGYFYKEDDEEDIFSNSVLFTTIIFTSSLIDSFFYAFLGAAEVELNILALIFTNGIFPAVYTALIGLAYSLLVRKK